MTTSLDLSTKRPNKKQKVKFAITDIINQDLRELLKNFNNSPDLCYKQKQVHDEPTEAYFLLIEHITKLIKSKRHFLLLTKEVKSGIDETKNFNKNKFTHQQNNSI